MLILWIVAGVTLLSSLAYFKYKLNQQAILINNLTSNKVDLDNEVKTLQEKMQTALTDNLTQLPSWQLFEDRLKQCLLESERYHFTMAILYVDINDFKVMNEALGSAAGDEILKETAKRLRDSIRQMDSVTRYTGGMFMVMLSRLNKPDSVGVVTQRILQALREEMKVNGKTLTISATIGVAVYPADGIDAGSLIKNADQALQLARKSHSTCQFYHPQIPLDRERGFLISSGLKSGQAWNELAINYQPVLNTQDQTVFCLTASLAWQHPVLGLISGDELLNEAERLGKANQLTRWLLEKVCREKRSPSLSSISISIQQLQNTQFIFQISQILQDAQFNPATLLLEIRNTSQTISWDVVEKSINMLKYLKIKLAVNDSGSPAFSLGQLKSFSVNYLFINSSLLDDAEHNPGTRQFLKATLELMQSLSMELIIQHVESEHQKKVLQDAGCYLIQEDFVRQNKYDMVTATP